MVDAVQRPRHEQRTLVEERRGQDPQVLTVFVRVAQLLRRAARGDRAVGGGDRQLVAEDRADRAVGRHDLADHRRPAQLRGQRRQLAQDAPGDAGRLDAPGDPLADRDLVGELAVDLRAQLAAHRDIGDHRRQHHGHAHRQRGHERDARPQRHGSRST